MIKQRTYDEIVQSIRNNIYERDPRVDSKAGTFVSDVLVQPQADELAAAYIDMKIMEINQSILTATGYDLDRLGMNYFTYRHAGTKASGRVRFFIKNSNKYGVTKDAFPEEVSIPEGLEVATAATATSDQLVFKTLSSAYMTQQQMWDMANTDESTGYRYIELPIECEAVGSAGNVEAGEVSAFYSDTVEGIVAVYNSLALTGGSDNEDDNSLRMRIMLSVLGASICTKNGYLKWVIQKDNVNDAFVVGAGDYLMYRDGGYINAAGSYTYGLGGMVDIWVRGELPITYTNQFTVTTSYKTGIGQEGDYEGVPCHDLVLDFQPVLQIVSIKSANTGYAFENAENFEIEYGYSGTSTLEKTYYKDVLWDFSVTEKFTDTEYYPMDVVDDTEVEVLRKQVNAELLRLMDEMTNVSFNLNWKTMYYEDISSYDVTPMFRKVSYNGNCYKLIALDKRLNGRMFVKKNNRIYLRVYQNPDFVLINMPYSDEQKTISQKGNDIGGSVYSKDVIHFTDTGKEKIQDGDMLQITYTTNALISTLQNEMNAMRILTADILIRQAKKVDIQIIVNLNIESTYDSTTIKNTIATALSTYINSMKRLGGRIEDSEIVTIIRSLSGVDHVDIENVTLCKVGGADVNEIILDDNEYFNLYTLSLNVTSGSTVES